MNDLPAGRELDALVAEKVMKWTLGRSGIGVGLWLASEESTGWVSEYPGDYDDLRGYVGVWAPSTNIAAAWEVVEKLRYSRRVEARWELETIDDGSFAGWAARIHYSQSGQEQKPSVGIGDTAPLTICRVALAAVRGRG